MKKYMILAAAVSLLALMQCNPRVEVHFHEFPGDNTLQVDTMTWRMLLEDLSTTIDTRVADSMTYYDRNNVTDHWLGFRGATEEEIQKKEAELGVKLPPSYRNFLLTSNGFKQINVLTGSLSSIERINWEEKEDLGFLSFLFDYPPYLPKKDYSDYSEEERDVIFVFEHRSESLPISEDGVIYLNPKIRYGDEWEAWLFSSMYGGGKRYHSFRELVEQEFAATVTFLDTLHAVGMPGDVDTLVTKEDWE